MSVLRRHGQLVGSSSSPSFDPKGRGGGADLYPRGTARTTLRGLLGNGTVGGGPTLPLL